MPIPPLDYAGTGHWLLVSHTASQQIIDRFYFGQAGRLDEWLRAGVAGALCLHQRLWSTAGRYWGCQLFGAQHLDELARALEKWPDGQWLELHWQSGFREQLPRRREQQRQLGRQLTQRSHDRLLGYYLVRLVRWWFDCPRQWLVQLDTEMLHICDWCAHAAYSWAAQANLAKVRCPPYCRRTQAWRQWLGQLKQRSDRSDLTYWLAT